MSKSTSSRRQGKAFSAAPARKASRGYAAEPLERRILLSAIFSALDAGPLMDDSPTVDTASLHASGNGAATPIPATGDAITTTTAVTTNNPSAVYGQPITFTATITPASSETGTVQFQIDGANAGAPISVSNNTAAYITSTLDAGTHSIVAIYSGDSTFATSTSPSLIQTVAQVAASNSWGTLTTVASLGITQDYSYLPGVVLDASGNIFGTTDTGGTYHEGSVFEIAHGSGVVTTLASFNGADGSYPSSGVVLDSSGNIFGTTGIFALIWPRHGF
jgi:hypothetical protein